MPEVLKQGSIDTWLFDIGRSIGRLEYISDVLTSHEHFSTDTALTDQTYHDAWSRYENIVHSRVFELTASQRRQAAGRLEEFIHGHRGMNDNPAGRRSIFLGSRL